MTTLTAQTIAALPAPAAGNKLYFFRGAIVQGRTVPRGLAVRVTAAGARAWVLNYALAGKARRLTIGDVADWSVTDAVKRARELRQEIDRGNDPMTERDQPPAPEVVTVNQVLDKFLERQKIRSLSQYESTFDRLVRPSLGSMPIADLRRRHIMELLDQVEDTRGPVAATRTLAYFRSAMNEWAKRDEDFTVPFVRGMARSSTSERARTRILTDDEIRAAWEVFGTMGNFGLSCRFILLPVPVAKTLQACRGPSSRATCGRSRRRGTRPPAPTPCPSRPPRWKSSMPSPRPAASCSPAVMGATCRRVAATWKRCAFACLPPMTHGRCMTCAGLPGAYSLAPA